MMAPVIHKCTTRIGLGHQSISNQDQSNNLSIVSHLYKSYTSLLCIFPSPTARSSLIMEAMDLHHLSLTLFSFTVPSTAEQEVKERPATPPPQPNLGELSVSDVTSDSVRLFWSVPVGSFDSFLIQYKDAEGKPQALPVDKETNSVVIYYLVPSHRYKFNLYGISGRRRFGPISVSTITGQQNIHNLRLFLMQFQLLF